MKSVVARLFTILFSSCFFDGSSFRLVRLPFTTIILLAASSLQLTTGRTKTTTLSFIIKSPTSVSLESRWNHYSFRSKVKRTPSSTIAFLLNHTTQKSLWSRDISSSSSSSAFTKVTTVVHSMSSSFEAGEEEKEKKPYLERILFIECGFGNDSHGQSSTKAAVRACRNAIEFNSIPSVSALIPGGYDNMKLDVILAVPKKYQSTLDLKPCANVFPYGNVKFTIQDGGMIAPSGISIERLGDTNDDMVVVCCSVAVGY